MDAKCSGVIVGVDGSTCARAALGWAAEDAAALGTTLTVTAVVDLPRLAEARMSSELLATATRGGREAAESAARRARAITPAVEVEVATGSPAAELMRTAADATELVVGSRGLGGFRTLALGSVGSQAAAHARCPVVVVRGEARPGPVIVGIDDSERSDAALAYAFAYADRHGLSVRAVHAYSLGAFSYSELPYAVSEELSYLRLGATRLVEQRLEPWTAKYPRVAVDIKVAEAGAAHMLVEASSEASLLVVGSHGHGGFAGILLGSVSQAAIRHANCPVAVAR